MTSQGNSTKHLEKLAPILKLLQRIVEEGTVQVLNITVILKQDKNIREKKQNYSLIPLMRLPWWLGRSACK